MRLFERCLAQAWREWSSWQPGTREQVLRSLVTFINGLTASAVVGRNEWPPERQIEQLKLQIELLRAWADRTVSGRRRGALAGGSAA